VATTVVGVLRLRKDFKLTMVSHGAALDGIAALIVTFSSS